MQRLSLKESRKDIRAILVHTELLVCMSNNYFNNAFLVFRLLNFGGSSKVVLLHSVLGEELNPEVASVLVVEESPNQVIHLYQGQNRDNNKHN